MNRILLSALLVVSIAACNNAETEATTEAKAPPVDNTEVVADPAMKAKLDPVCEMTCDTSWTEYAVYLGDTVKFCSESCKTAFVARPEKFLKGDK